MLELKRFEIVFADWKGWKCEIIIEQVDYEDMEQAKHVASTNALLAGMTLVCIREIERP